MMNHDPFGLNVAPPLSIKFVDPDRNKVVVLARIADEPHPDHCIHGRTRCFACDEWCHLGPETLKVVESGAAMPMCMPCATGVVSEDGKIGYADDRRGSHR